MIALATVLSIRAGIVAAGWVVVGAVQRGQQRRHRSTVAPAEARSRVDLCATGQGGLRYPWHERPATSAARLDVLGDASVHAAMLRAPEPGARSAAPHRVASDSENEAIEPLGCGSSSDMAAPR